MTKKFPSNNKEEKKTTSEKPVSLSPLDLEEAIAGMLGVKPKEEEKEEEIKANNGES